MQTNHVVAAVVAAAGVSVAGIVAAIVCQEPGPSNGPNPVVNIVNVMAGRVQGNACSLILPWR